MENNQGGDTSYEANYEEDSNAEKYFHAPWSTEIATKFIEIIHRERPFQHDDVIIDFGCGPGLGLDRAMRKMEYSRGIIESTFTFIRRDINHLLQFVHRHFFSNPSGNRKKSIDDASLLNHKNKKICPLNQILAVDISEAMVRRCSKLIAENHSETEILCKRIDAFNIDGSISVDFVSLFESIMKPEISCFMCSLVMEYLTEVQIKALIFFAINKLSVGGVIALCDWCEHFPYPSKYIDSIPHMRGFKKTYLLRIAAEVIDAIERPDRVQVHEQHKEPGDIFPWSPPYRLRCVVGSFRCDLAFTQQVPSGDSVHYLIISKECAPLKIATNHRSNYWWRTLHYVSVLYSVTVLLSSVFLSEAHHDDSAFVANI